MDYQEKYIQSLHELKRAQQMILSLVVSILLLIACIGYLCWQLHTSQSNERTLSRMNYEAARQAQQNTNHAK